MARRSGRGQALVEFAFVVVPFVFLLWGIIEFGRYVYSVQILNNAAREGARYAITHGSTSLCPSGPMPGGATNPCDPTGARVVSVVRNQAIAVGGVSFPSQTCTTTPANPCWQPSNQRGSTVTVTVQSTYTVLLPIPLGPITVTGTSTLIVNH